MSDEENNEDRIQRLIRLEQMILRKPMSRPSLAILTGVSFDTTRRDIQQLREMGSDAVFIKNLGWKSTSPVFTANMKHGAMAMDKQAGQE